MTDAPKDVPGQPQDDGALVCRVHGCACTETTDCGCPECTEHKMASYLAERNAQLNTRMAFLRRRYRNLPSSSVIMVDQRILYVWTAEQMLARLCKLLELPPTHIRLVPDPRLLIPPEVNVMVPEAMARNILPGVKKTDTDEREIKQMLHDHIQGIVRSVAEEFAVEWEKRRLDFGYLRPTERESNEPGGGQADA